MYKVIHIRNAAFSEEHWRSYFDLLVKIKVRFKTMLSSRSWEQMRDRVASFCEMDEGFHPMVVSDGDEIIGWGQLWVRDTDAPEPAGDISLDAYYDEIPRKFVHRVASEIEPLMKHHGCIRAHSMTESQRISDAIRMWRPRELNRVDRFRLYRKKANLEAIDHWLKTIPAANSDLRLELFDPVPEEHLPAYVETFERFINEMPTEREELQPYRITIESARKQTEWRQKNNVHLYTYALLNQQDNLVAHSNASINELNPADVYQAITGVLEEYRGRGIAKWLKAALFRKIGEDFPANESMTTDMRAVNEPIQAVNRQMGYVLESQGNEFETSVNDLSRWLQEEKD
ncbi:MAG: hypothetical protein KAU36_00990 [candidate division Zixibacteria bacterium]|nr:hypothetical protein [candidate division Zixibacteria bacterium]